MKRTTMWRVLAALLLPILAAPAWSGVSTDAGCWGNGTSELCINSSGNLAPNDGALSVVGDLTATGATTVAAVLSVNGNTTLGDSGADSVDMNATTMTINATVTGFRVSTTTTSGYSILTIDGSNKRVGIGGDDTPDVKFDVRMNGETAAETIFQVSSANAKGLLGVQASGNVYLWPNAVYTTTFTALTGNLDVPGALTVSGKIKMTSVGIKTKTELGAITPAVGDIYLCSDCALPYDICVGTGAVLSGFRNMANGGTGCGANN